MKQKISEEKYLELESVVWEEFLNQATQEDIYHSLLTSNWDGNDFLLRWIMDKPTIDKAIVLAAYWLSEPYFAKQYVDRNDVTEKVDWYLDGFDFTERIEKQYCEGFYTTSALECDPKIIELLESYDALADRTILNPNINPIREIPAVMFKKLTGTKIKSIDYHAYTEGLPNAYYDKIDAIFEAYDIVY